MIAFMKRNLKEMLRDPLAYIFCLGFPIVMLIMMSVIDRAIPPEAGNTLYHIDSMTPGIAVFGLTFVMLQGALLVSRDRTTALLARLFASPLPAVGYLAGYGLPLCIVGVAQIIVSYVAGGIIAAVEGTPLSFSWCVQTAAALLPSLLFFTGLGILLGTLLNDRAAAPVASTLITAGALLGGVWTPIELMGEGFFGFCRCLPFYHAAHAARTPADAGVSFAVLAGYTVAVWLSAVAVFRRRMKG